MSHYLLNTLHCSTSLFHLFYKKKLRLRACCIIFYKVFLWGIFSFLSISPSTSESISESCSAIFLATNRFLIKFRSASTVSGDFIFKPVVADFGFKISFRREFSTSSSYSNFRFCSSLEKFEVSLVNILKLEIIHKMYIKWSLERTRFVICIR